MSQVQAVKAHPLSIALVGVGGIGSAFAYQLARAGHEVTVVARPGSARLLQLRRDSGIVRTSGERAETRVADSLAAETAFDLVLVTTLAHQVGALVPALAASQARHVHFMMNNFNPETLAAAVGAARCSFGMPFVQARVTADGRLDVKIGKNPKTLHGDARWVALFAQAGIPSELEPQMARWLRCHVPLCMAMESIAFRAQARGAEATWADAVTVARGLQGGFAVVEGLGDSPLYPAAKRVMRRMPDLLVAGLLWGLSKNKAFRELLATGVAECRELVEVVAAEAEAGAVDAAAIAAVRGLKP